MKKIVLGVLVVLVVLSLSGKAAASMLIPVAGKAKEKAGVAVEKSPATEGDWALKTPGLEKIEFIHWKKGFAKPTCDDGVVHPSEQCGEPGLGECPTGTVCINCKCVAEEEPTPPATCYAFLGQYGKRLLQWREFPVSYVINPNNPDNLLEVFVTSAISAGAEEWDKWTGAKLFDDVYGIDGTAIYGVQDYVNAIAWGNYPTEGVIGVTTVWYNPATKTVVEFDVMFDTDWKWGDCEGKEATCYGGKVMDLQNIATHELGHGVGLDDVYETTCAEVTMYGRSDYGETNKRTLEEPDKTGIQKLYGQ